MTLPAFAAERRHLLHGARSCRLISPADTSGPCNFAVYSKNFHHDDDDDAGAQQQTRRPLLLPLIYGTCRQPEGHPTFPQTPLGKYVGGQRE